VLIENAWETLKGRLQEPDVEKILGKKQEVFARLVDQKEGTRRQKGYLATIGGIS